jgi:uncharacterized membrane protein YkoI
MDARRTGLMVILAGLVTGALEVPAAAAATPQHLALASAGLSMDQAVKMVEQRFHARVVKAETQRDGARSVYVLRLLDPSGKVWTVRVNAADGTLQ